MNGKRAKKERQYYKKKINEAFDNLENTPFKLRLKLAWGVLRGKNNLIEETTKKHK